MKMRSTEFVLATPSPKPIVISVCCKRWRTVCAHFTHWDATATQHTTLDSIFLPKNIPQKKKRAASTLGMGGADT